MRVVLAVATVALLLGMVQKTPCVAANWSGPERYSAMCYSDIPYLYTGRGFAELSVPYGDNGGRYPALEYPVVIGYFAYGAAVLTHLGSGWPDLDQRAEVSADEVFAQPGVADESGLYFVITAILLALAGLAAAWFMAGAHRGRPWDAMLFAAAPTLVLAGLINWDLLAVAAAAGSMWAWARDRPILTGVLIGLGTAAKLYPLFLLGALFVVCLRRRRMQRFLLAAGAAVLTWVVVNAPAIGYGNDSWKAFWSFNSDRGADLGSLWLVWQQAGHVVSPGLINVVSLTGFVAVCIGVFVLGMLARRTPRIPQLAFLIVVGFLLVNKVYSPQYVLWLLPFAVLARPRWRDIAIWQAGEIFYFGAVWLYLGEYTAPGGSGEPDRFYWLAIAVRVACQLYLAAVIVRDILKPRLDPVRADGVTDDPMHPHALASGQLPPSLGRRVGRKPPRWSPTAAAAAAKPLDAPAGRRPSARYPPSGRRRRLAESGRLGSCAH